MDASFWQTRWEEGRIGWHREAVHTDLIAQEPELPRAQRILVPLCGKSLDVAWLADKGHTVVGCELSPKAAEQLFAEAGLTPTVTEEGPFTVYRSGAVTVFVGNVLDATPAHLGTFDGVWDRAALVALQPTQRVAYAGVIRGLLKPEGWLLLNTLSYPQHEMSGPPHAVPESEIADHYDGWSMVSLREEDALDARFRERGLTEMWSSLRLLEKPA